MYRNTIGSHIPEVHIFVRKIAERSSWSYRAASMISKPFIDQLMHM